DEACCDQARGRERAPSGQTTPPGGLVWKSSALAKAGESCMVCVRVCVCVCMCVCVWVLCLGLERVASVWLKNAAFIVLLGPHSGSPQVCLSEAGQERKLLGDSCALLFYIVWIISVWQCAGRT